MKKEIPCRDCEDRETGCHSRCGRYKEWRAWYDAKKEKENKARDAEYRAHGYMVEVAERKKKLNKKHIRNGQI